MKSIFLLAVLAGCNKPAPPVSRPGKILIMEPEQPDRADTPRMAGHAVTRAIDTR